MTRRIPRTALSYRPRAVTLITDQFGDAFPFVDTVEVSEHPTHSSVLGPDGEPLEYEPRQPAGFDLSPRGKG